MRKHALPFAIFFILTYILLTCQGVAENPTDITPLCTLSVSANTDQMRLLVDDDPASVWASDDDMDQFIEILKPTGEATLTVVWDTLVPTIALESFADGAWTELLRFYGADPMPETFFLPTSATQVRLRGDAEMRIAEIRVSSGKNPHYLADHLYEFDAIDVAFLVAPTPKPLQRGVTNHEVKELQSRLSELGYTVRSINATFGENTYEELKKFQGANGFKETGVLDTKTKRILYSDAAIAATPSPKPFDPADRVPRTASELIAFVQGRIGSGYVYGSSGELCDARLREARAVLYPHYAKSLLGIAAQWDGGEVYDCVGLVKAFLGRSIGEFPETWNTNVIGAAKRWMSELEPIATMPREPGLLLLQMDPETGEFMHMGVYTGNGMCVHARGHMYGVVEDPMPQLWTHWARPSWLTFDIAAEKTTYWPPYLAGGDRALVDTSYGGDLPLYTLPSASEGRFTGVRLTNKSTIIIDDIPDEENASFWRRVTSKDRRGKSVTGYVYAKDLTALPASVASKK